MTTTVFIYLTGSDASPSADALKGYAHHLTQPILCEVNGNYVVEATTIGTGMLGIDHGISMRKALSFDPLRLHPLRTTDCDYPWVWDLATSSGLRAAVFGWPGILDASDSPTPMVSERAMLEKPDQQ